MGYRAPAEPNSDAEASALGAFHRRLLRLRLWVILPSLFAAAVAALYVAADGFTYEVTGYWGSRAFGWGMVGVAAGAFAGVLAAGWLLYRVLLRWRSGKWLPRLARWYGVPRDLLEERTLPFQEGSRLEPWARRELRWRVALAALLGLLVSVATSFLGGWMMGIH